MFQKILFYTLGEALRKVKGLTIVHTYRAIFKTKKDPRLGGLFLNKQEKLISLLLRQHQPLLYQHQLLLCQRQPLLFQHQLLTSQHLPSSLLCQP